MTLMFIPITIVTFNAERILVAIGQHPDVSKYAGQYVLINLPGIYLCGLSDCQKRLLNNFGKTKISFYANLIAMITHYFWCSLFVIKLELGITGTGIANVITNTIFFATLYTFTHYQEDLKEAIFMPDRRTLDSTGIKEYVKLGVPSIIMICLDWWVWELMVLMCGYFPFIVQEIVYQQAA